MFVLLDIFEFGRVYKFVFRGAVYMNTQNPIHTKPRAPMMTNAISHPQALASNGMLRGAIRAPIEAPALKMEVA